jgi:hypothetical protein
MKIYLKQKEVEALQKAGELLTRPQIIEKIFNKYGDDITDKLIVKYCDYRDNPIAPERFAYSLSFINFLTGKRVKCTYWLYSVGMQG